MSIYTEYPDENKIVFHEGFNEELSDGLLQKIEEYSEVIFPDSFDKSIDRIKKDYKCVRFGSKYTIYLDRIEFPSDFNSELDDILLELIGKYNLVSFPFGYSKSIQKIKSSGKTCSIDYGWKYMVSLDNTDEIFVWGDTKIDEQMIEIISRFSIIKFSSIFNEQVDHLPNSIKEIIFGSEFNQPIDNLPVSVIKINMKSYKFNYPVDNLPESLESLELGPKFNQPIDNLPYKLKVLLLDKSFKHPINNLPISLIELHIDSENYYHSLDCIPDSIKKLILSGSNFKFSKLPSHLEHLEMKSYEQNFSFSILPNTLRYLELPNSFDGIIDLHDTNLTHLELGDNFNNPIDNLPDSITNLKFGKKFDLNVNKWPNHLKNLKFGNNFNKPVDNLPEGLITLVFGNCFKHTVDKLPSTLKKLIFGCAFKKTLNNLPFGLELLVLGTEFNQSLDNLPDTIKILEIKWKFTQSINKLPSSLKFLRLDLSISDIKIMRLPESILKIKYCYSLNKNIEQFISSYPNIKFISDYEYDKDFLF